MLPVGSRDPRHFGRECDILTAGAGACAAPASAAVTAFFLSYRIFGWKL